MKYNGKEMAIRYLNEEKGKIRLFGEKFIENNKNIFKIIYNNKEYDVERFMIGKNNIKDSILEIKFIIYKDIINLSYMFYNCSSLISLTSISNLNTNNVTDMSFMF